MCVYQVKCSVNKMNYISANKITVMSHQKFRYYLGLIKLCLRLILFFNYFRELIIFSNSRYQKLFIIFTHFPIILFYKPMLLNIKSMYWHSTDQVTVVNSTPTKVFAKYWEIIWACWWHTKCIADNVLCNTSIQQKA